VVSIFQKAFYLLQVESSTLPVSGLFNRIHDDEGRFKSCGRIAGPRCSRTLPEFYSRIMVNCGQLHHCCQL
jgi:hypothetical protein